MTEQQIVDVVIYQPTIRAMQGEDNEKRRSIETIIPMVTDEISVSYDWDFVLAKAVETSVANQPDYVLKGNNRDCRDIINIRFGDNNKLLNKRDAVDLDEYLDGRTISTVMIWTPIARKFGFPQIKLTDAPDSSTDDITYRYRRKDVPLSEFPDEFLYVFISGVMKNMVPQFRGLFKDDINNMIRRYSGEGGEDDPAKQDPLIVYRNNRRSNMFGYGGSNR